ncbi:hypothetical protein [Rhizorhabdus phycosphaerae]|uniref:hypothetical protein n=1 Tax=Rhizorhabdus phycosphaerae TaxID=2711156 RepID=UPI0013EAB211|nr:hypothetical protein [Rhizorhabdus phycosphaerae]
MRLRFYAAIIVFLGSYLPLSVILLVQNVRFDLWGTPFCDRFSLSGCEIPLREPAISLSFLLVCLLCFAFTLIVVRAIRVQKKISVSEVKHIPADLMNYVLPYVVSFMGIDYSDVGKFAGFIVFLIWIFIITYRSERIVMNPVLVVFGWKLFEIKYSNPGGQVVSTAMALSNIELNVGTTYKTNAIQDVIIVK